MSDMPCPRPFLETLVGQHVKVVTSEDVKQRTYTGKMLGLTDADEPTIKVDVQGVEFETRWIDVARIQCPPQIGHATRKVHRR